MLLPKLSDGVASDELLAENVVVDELDISAGLLLGSRCRHAQSSELSTPEKL